MTADEHLAQALDIGRTIPLVLAHTLAYLLAGGLAGRAMGRRWLEGMALGFLVLAGAGDMALLACRALALPLPWFLPLAALLTLALILFARKAVFADAAPEPSPGLLAWLVFLGLAGILLAVRMLTPDPQAGYGIFQGFYPLYLESSVRLGRFLTPGDMGIGDGLLTGGSLAYPPDLVGLAALGHAFSALAHPAYLGVSVASAVAALAILVHGLNRRPLALLLFALLFLAYLRWGAGFRTVIGDNWSDGLIYLPGAAALVYLGQGNRTTAPFAAVFALSFMSLGRPYGLVFAALPALALFAADMRDRAGRQRFLRWVAMAAAMAALASRELGLVALHGPYYARPNMPDMYSLPWEATVKAIIGDLGLLAEASHFALPVPIALAILPPFAWLVWSRRAGLRRRPMVMLAYLAPLLLVLGPVAVEVLTGFRKAAFSKLYIAILFLFPWYPAWLVSRLATPAGVARILRGAAPWLCRAALATALLAAALAALFSQRLEARWEQAVERYRAHNVDLTLARALDQAGLLEQAAARRVLYLYGEPGYGLRYYIGGDLFADADFWCDSVQKEIRPGRPLADILAALGYPSIYKPYDGWRSYGRWVSGDGWQKLADEIDRLEDSPLVSARVAVPGGVFYFTAPDLPGAAP